MRSPMEVPSIHKFVVVFAKSQTCSIRLGTSVAAMVWSRICSSLTQYLGRFFISPRRELITRTMVPCWGRVWRRRAYQWYRTSKTSLPVAD